MAHADADHIADCQREPVRLRIFEEANGYHWCDDSLDYLDARGSASASIADATRTAILCTCEWGRDPATITIVGGSAHVARKMRAHAAR